MTGNRQLVAALSCAVVLGAAMAAGATDVTATFDSSQLNTVSVTLWSNYNDPPTGSASVTSVGTVAGVYNFTIESEDSIARADGLGISTNVFKAVCIDFTHNVSYGQTGLTFDVENLGSVTTTDNGVGISTTQAGAIACLWDTYSFGPSPNQAAAFQMAVWDLIYSPAYSIATSPAPSVSYTDISTSIINAAAHAASVAWSQAASFEGGAGVYALVNTNTDPTDQSFNFAIVGPNGGPQNILAVPLPASASVGFSMLGGFGLLFFFRRRMNRRQRIA